MRNTRRVVSTRWCAPSLRGYRLVPPVFSGISPLELPYQLAQKPGVSVADGEAVNFGCGRRALEVLKADEAVEKYDDYPALSAAFLPERYRTPRAARVLARGAFNVARLAGQELYVFRSLEELVAMLAVLPLEATGREAHTRHVLN
jgi:hypothetical protein